jgi:hypothetical protein
MAAALIGLMVGGAQAQVTTERSASILVFPRVISEGTHDTIIQITNTSNSMVFAHCFYVNGAPTFPDLPPCHNTTHCTNPPLWQELDFDIALTQQQPTHWVVSKGRLVDPTDRPCTNGSTNPPVPPFFECNDAGIDPGRIPPEVDVFTGELKCIEVTMDGAPVSGNHLKGEATIVSKNVCDPFLNSNAPGRCFVNESVKCLDNGDCDSDTFDVAKYNALGIVGNENNDGDNVLCLGGQPSDQCPNGAEYDACPATWIANFIAEEAPDPVAGNESFVETSWTFVPCTQNFETQVPETVTVQINAFNEFETNFSAVATVTCWDELFLDQINPIVFNFLPLGSTFGQARLRPSANSKEFLMVGHEVHVSAPFGWASDADFNLHVEGTGGQNLITIPAEQISGGGAGPTP